jgi:exopolysaccharide biosynthesis polyprenyl glycosylphosphotransferase
VSTATASPRVAVASRGLQRSEHRLLLVAGDSAVALAAVALALWIWSLTTGFPFGASFVRRSFEFFLLAPLWVALLAPSRKLSVALSLEQTFRAIVGAGAVLGAMYLGVFFYAPRALPRLPALYFLWEAALLTAAWRLIYLYAVVRAGLRRRALVIGAGGETTGAIALLQQHSRDLDIVRVVDHDELARRSADLDLDTGVAVEDLAHEHRIDDIVLVGRGPFDSDLLQALVRCQQRGLSVVPFAIEYEQLLMRVPVAHLPPDWMFASLPEWVRARDASRAAKRTVDLVGAVIGALVLVMLAPFVAAAIVMESGRPVFYRQRRIGAGGREFPVWKFRTMVREAEAEGPRWAAPDDDRVTRIGRWLRHSRLDELPQMINVLRGEMSLVGPRPERPEFASELESAIPFYRTRLMVQPGLTGWAQINAAYGASVADAVTKLEYDLYYIKHRSVAFDLWILVRTVATVLKFGGR